MENKSDKQLSQYKEQIIRYVQDRMSEPERHSFEREMQADPFLNEAVEGYLLFSVEAVSYDLTELNKALYKKKPNRRYLWMAAASLAILVVSSLVFFDWQKRGQYPVVSENQVQKHELKETAEEKATPVKNLSELPKSKRSEKKLMNVEQQHVVNESEGSSILASTSVAEDNKTIQMPAQLQPNDSNLKEMSSDMMALEIEDSEDTMFLNPSESYSIIKTSKSREKTIVPDMNKPEKNNQVDEVVVVGYGIQKERKLTGSVTTIPVIKIADDKAKPEMGWEAFNEYLKSELVHPKIGRPGRRTVVKISFVVTTSGGKEQLVIQKSDDPKYNEEAIRIVKDGPKWVPGIKDKQPVNSAVELKLVFPALGD